MPDKYSSQYPDKDALSANERLEIELSNLKLMFPNKKFGIAEDNGIRRIEVILNW
jgi:hypothetical protein